MTSPSFGSDEVNWKQGTITRARSKTRERKGPVVTYKLWPETFALLRKYRAQGRAGSDQRGGQPAGQDMAERTARCSDMTRSTRRGTGWQQKMGLTKMRLGMKHLRKTSATVLGQHPQYKFYATYFLADSPKGWINAITSSRVRAEFFSASVWLRGQLLGSIKEAAETRTQRLPP